MIGDDESWQPSWDYVEIRRMTGLCFSGCSADCPCPTGRRWQAGGKEGEGKPRDDLPSRGQRADREGTPSRPQADVPRRLHAKQANFSAMTAEEYRAIMTALGLNQTTLAKRLKVSRVTSFRWANGTCRIPHSVRLTLEGLARNVPDGIDEPRNARGYRMGRGVRKPKNAPPRP